MGLSAIGISQQIQSIDPPDPGVEAAKVCAFWYPICRNALLREAPWNFAYQYVLLASDPSAVPGFPQYAYPGWTYAYQYPLDCLQAIALSTYEGIRWGPAMWAAWWFPYPTGNVAIPKIPFKVVQSTANPGQLMILADIASPAYLFYIQAITNTGQFDVLFSDCLALYIAAKAGGPLRAAADKVKTAQAAYELGKARALAQSLNENQQDVERPSPSVQIRY